MHQGFTQHLSFVLSQPKSLLYERDEGRDFIIHILENIVVILATGITALSR